eukprot:3764625-Heterocapsa_arctica.AAC.1
MPNLPTVALGLGLQLVVHVRVDLHPCGVVDIRAPSASDFALRELVAMFRLTHLGREPMHPRLHVE